MTQKKKVKNYYQILGVEYTASKEEINIKFQEIVKSNSINLDNKENISEDIKEILEAYNNLYNEYIRLDYDVAYRKIMKMGGFENYKNNNSKPKTQKKPDINSLYPQVEQPQDRLNRLTNEITMENSDKQKNNKKLIKLETSNLNFNYTKKHPLKKAFLFLLFLVVIVIIPIFFIDDLSKQFNDIFQFDNIKQNVSSWFDSSKEKVITPDKKEEIVEKENIKVSVKETTKKKIKSKKKSKKRIRKDKKLTTFQLSKRAQKFLDNQEYNKAIKYYKKLAEKHKTRFEAYQSLGDIYTTLNKFDTAIEYFTKALTLYPKNDQLFAKRAYAYNQKKHYTKAIDDMSIAIGIDQYNTNYSQALCQLYIEYSELQIKNKDFKKALYNLKKSLNFDKKNEDTYFNMGRIMNETKQYKKAIEMYKKAIRLNPSHEDVYYYLAKDYLDYGRYYRDKKKFTQSLKYLKLVNKTDNTNRLSNTLDLALTYNAIGKYKFDKKERKEAVKYLTKSLDYNKKDKTTFYLLGKAYYELDKYQDSKTSLKKAIKLGSKKAQKFYTENQEDFVIE